MAIWEYLRPGDRVRIVGFSTHGVGYRRKLQSLGLTAGATVEIVRLPRKNEPLEIMARGFSLSLRREEAAALEVEKL